MLQISFFNFTFTSKFSKLLKIEIFLNLSQNQISKNELSKFMFVTTGGYVLKQSRRSLCRGGEGSKVGKCKYIGGGLARRKNVQRSSAGTRSWT